jgi:hypothetical protein
MKGFYSRGKKNELEARLKQEKEEKRQKNQPRRKISIKTDDDRE